MKLFVFILFSALTIPVHAQEKKLDAIKASLETLRLAMISGDKTALLKITSPGLSYGHSSGITETQEQFAEKIASGKSDFVSISTSNETITLYKNTAIVRHQMEAQTNDAGKPGSVKLQVLLVWVKEKKSWMLAARQAVKAL